MRFWIAYLVVIHIVLAIGVYRKIVQYTTPDLKDRRTILKAAPMPENAIVFLGDSLTQSLEPDIPAVNLGIAGNSTKDLNDRMGDYDFSRVRSIVLMIGTNDAVNYREPQKLNLPDVPVYWYAVPPVDGKVVENCNWFIKKINARFRKECAEHPQCTFIELDLADEQGNLKYHVGDGVHLNAQGQEIWNESIRKSVHF